MWAYWDAGLKLLEGYGLTEAGIIACNTVDRYRLGTVGSVLDPAAFRLSEEGEVLIRQPHPLSLGYLDAEDANSPFEPDGTIRTGDQGKLDEDRLPDPGRSNEGYDRSAQRQEAQSLRY